MVSLHFNKWNRVSSWLPIGELLTNLFLCILRYGQAWDSHPDAGYIMAGGFNSWTGGACNVVKVSRTVERSTNNGSSFFTLPDIPYGCNDQRCNTCGNGNGGLFGACLVIIDANTAFMAGGRMGKIKSRLHLPHTMS